MASFEREVDDTTSADIVAYIFFYFTSAITCYMSLQAH